MPLQYCCGLESVLIFHVLRLQHALVIAQQSRGCEDRLVTEAGRLQEVIVSAASDFAVAVAVNGTVANSRNIVVVFGNAVLVLAGVVESRVTQSLGSVTLRPIGIVRQIALVQIELLEVLSDIELLR